MPREAVGTLNRNVGSWQKQGVEQRQLQRPLAPRRDWQRLERHLRTRAPAPTLAGQPYPETREVGNDMVIFAIRQIVPLFFFFFFFWQTLYIVLVLCNIRAYLGEHTELHHCIY